jgi:transposase
LSQLVQNHNDATLAELCRLVQQQFKKRLSLPVMCRVLRALGLPRKKKTLHACERDSPRVQQLRSDYQQQVSPVERSRLKFIDESGVNLAMTRLFARAPVGQRAIGTVPQNYGSNVTMLASLGCHGLDALMTVEGATDGEVFRVYVDCVLGPTLRPGDIVVMDNLGAHKVRGICEAIEGCGAQLIYLPPYSPDLSPIEPCWSKIKTVLRGLGARTRDALDAAIKEAMRTITAADALAWFTHCGYLVN